LCATRRVSKTTRWAAYCISFGHNTPMKLIGVPIRDFPEFRQLVPRVIILPAVRG
jgi:hypothetical protein